MERLLLRLKKWSGDFYVFLREWCIFWQVMMVGDVTNKMFVEQCSNVSSQVTARVVGLRRWMASNGRRMCDQVGTTSPCGHWSSDRWLLFSAIYIITSRVQLLGNVGPLDACQSGVLVQTAGCFCDRSVSAQRAKNLHNERWAHRVCIALGRTNTVEQKVSGYIQRRDTYIVHRTVC